MGFFDFFRAGGRPSVPSMVPPSAVPREVGRPVGNGQLPVQSLSSMDINQMDPEMALQMLVNHSFLSDIFMVATTLGQNRTDRYREYDLMEESGLINSFLELITEDATQADMDLGKTVWIAEDCPHKEDLEELLYDIIDVDDLIGGWCYQLAKYGDMFVKPEVEEGKGILWVRDDIHPSDVWRIDINGRLVAFAFADNYTPAYAAPGTGDMSQAMIFDRWSMVHFMFNYRPTFEKVRISIPKKLLHDDFMGKPLRDGFEHYQQFLMSLNENLDGEALQRMRDVLPEGEAYFMTGRPVSDYEQEYLPLLISSRYGSSALYNVRKEYKILNLVEQALALGRLSRSAVARVFYVNTTDANVRERKEMLDYIDQMFKKKQSFNATSDLYKSDYSPLNYLDDIVLPITGDKGDVRVEQIGGDLDIKAIVDIDYYKNKVFSGMRVPQAYMGFEESLPGWGGNKALTALDIRYARQVKKLQRGIQLGMVDLCYTHLRSKYPNEEIDLAELKGAVKMATISGAEERDRMESMNEKIAAAQNVLGFVEAAGGDTFVAGKALWENFIGLNFPDLTADEIFTQPPVEEVPSEGGATSMGASAEPTGGEGEGSAPGEGAGGEGGTEGEFGAGPAQGRPAPAGGLGPGEELAVPSGAAVQEA